MRPQMPTCRPRSAIPVAASTPLEPAVSVTASTSLSAPKSGGPLNPVTTMSTLISQTTTTSRSRSTILLISPPLLDGSRHEAAHEEALSRDVDDDHGDGRDQCAGHDQGLVEEEAS